MKNVFKFIQLLVLLCLFQSMQQGLLAQPSAESGKKMLQYEKYESAKKIFTSLINSTPDEPENYYYRGCAYYELNKKDSAKLDFDKGTSLAGKPFGAALCYAGSGKLLLDLSRTSEANTAFSKAFALTSSKDTRIYRAVAEAYIDAQNKNIPEAISLLTKSQALDKKNAETYLMLGNAYSQQVDGGGSAVSNYENAIAQNAKMAEAHYRIGVLYAGARNYEEALKAFQKCLAADAEYVPVYRELGELYHKMKKTADAKDAYSKYIAMAENNIITLTRYVQFQFLTKDYNGTINLAQQILKTDSSNAMLYRLIGYSSFEMASYAQAQDAMNRFFAKADPKKVIATDYEYYGKILAKTKTDSLAVIYLNKAIVADTANGELHGDIAQIYYKQKKYADAAQEYKLKMKSVAPKSADYFLLGQAQYFANLYQEADSAFMKVIEMKPAVHIGYLWRGRCNSLIDSNYVTGQAKPFYEKTVETILADSVSAGKYKKELIESYLYLGSYFLFKDDEAGAKPFYKKVMDLDPENESAKKALDPNRVKKPIKKK